MRIAYVADARIPTEKAHGLQIMQMCAAFASLGHEVTLFVPDRKNPIGASPFAYYGIEEGFRVVKVPVIDLVPWSRRLGRFASLFTTFGFALRARRAVAAWEPDLVYSRDRFSPLWSPDDAEHVVEIHTMPRSGRALFRRLWNMSDRVVAVTEGLRADLEKMGVRKEKLMTAHDAVDPHRFQVPHDKEEVRAALGLPQDEVLAVYVGRFYREQGVDALMRAAERLRSAKVVFIGGEGECANGVFPGRLPHADVPRWLAAADIAVMPYVGDSLHVRRYASPMKLFEYLAAGLPIVSSDLPSVREVLTEDAGVFVPPDDPDALAAAIDSLAADRERLRSMGEASARLGRAHGWVARAASVIEGLPRPAGDRFRTFLRRWRTELAVGALALALRLVYVLFFPQQSLVSSDATLYLGIADALLGRGGWEGLPTFWQPGYPHLLAGIRWLFGDSLVWPRVVQAVLSAGTVVVVARLARRWLGGFGSLAAGLIMALHVPAVLDAGVMLTETTYTFFLTLGFFGFLTALDDAEGGSWRLWMAGTFFGLAGSVREIGFYLAGVMAAVAVFAKRGRLAVAVLACVALFAGAVAFQQRSRAPEGSEARLFAKGYEQTLLEDDVFRENATDPSRLRMYAEGGARYLALPYRLTDLSSGTSMKALVLERDVPGLRGNAAELVGKAVVIGMHLLVLLLAVIGLFWGRLPLSVRAAVFFAVGASGGSIVLASVGYPAGFAVFEPLARYRFPVEPLIVLLAAAGVHRLSGKGRAARFIAMFLTKQYLLFVVIGVTGVAMNLALTYLLTEFAGLYYFFSYVISTLAVWTVIFTLHSRMTFRGHSESERSAYLRFVTLYVVLTLMNWALVWTLTSLLGVHYLLSILVVTATISVLSFLGNRVIVFDHAG